MTRTGCPQIDDYADGILSGRILAGEKLKNCIRYILQRVTDKRVRIDQAKIDRALELIERYFPFELFDWERFVLALVHCYVGDEVLFREFLIVMGTGNGKNGFISALTWYFTTQDHGIPGYNIDIIANSEEQAKTSFDEIHDMLSVHEEMMKGHFYWSKTLIESRHTKSYIKYNTSNAKTRAGKRAACLIFDEVFGYATYDVINEYRASFGKRPHSRIFKITSQGNVRDGVLDNELKIADVVIAGENDDLRMCPLIYGVETEEEVLDPDMWIKANPSLPYLKPLQEAIKADFAEIKYNSKTEEMFYTKRMNWPKMDREMAVATHDELRHASRPIGITLDGMDCVAGLDYALLSDMASIGLLFRDGDERIWIQHSWICRQSCDWDRIKAPLNDWQDQKDLTIVDDVQIDPYLITAWLKEAMGKYNVMRLGMDLARFALMREVLGEIGFDPDRKTGNIQMVRPLQIASVSPVIESWFRTGVIRWGDIPLMRWAANNTKRIRMSAAGASGNYKYDKIEPRSRKNDPFMALVHAAVLDEELTPANIDWIFDLPAATG